MIVVKAGILNGETADERVFIRITGHARFARKGSDIVCAAVSALAQTYIHGLVELASATVNEKGTTDDFEVEALTGVLAKENRNNALLLYRQLLIGIREIAAGYPEYVRMENEEKTDGS